CARHARVNASRPSSGSLRRRKKREEHAAEQEQARDNPVSDRGSQPLRNRIIRRPSKSATPLQSAVTKNTSVNPLECAHTNRDYLLDKSKPKPYHYPLEAGYLS